MPNEELGVIVELNGEFRTVYVPANSDYEELLDQLNLNPEEVLVFVGGHSVPLDQRVDPGTVRVLKVVSGG